jgi:molybdopterin synthase catalytic subunit
MRALAAQARRRWPLRKVAMAHRIGVVPVGQASVAIAVSSGHRGEAFEACRWLIDRLKEIVPIWKKEHYRGGEVWIGAQQGSPPARKKTSWPNRRIRATRK